MLEQLFEKEILSPFLADVSPQEQHCPDCDEQMIYKKTTLGGGMGYTVSIYVCPTHGIVTVPIEQ